MIAMDDEKLLQIADDQLNFLDRMSALHRQRMLDSIQALERRIVDRASALKTSESGNLLGAKTNLAQAQKVHADMTTLFDEEYGAASRETVKEYSESLPVIQQQYEEMGEAVKYTGVDRDMVKGLKSMDLAAYASYGLAAQDKIAKAVYNHVIAQAPFSALVSEIAAALTGQKDKRGRPLANHAKQMANDGIMNFHNTVNLKKAEDAGFTHYLYVGNIIADSRPFCIARAGNVYTREQIDSWTGTWQGKSGPAFTHRGGYNCRHHWQPVRKEWIPEGGIEVQSWFDRAGVMPVSKLPKAVTEVPKFKAYQAWQQSKLSGGWKPSMSREEASDFVRNSAYQQSLYHGTSAKAASSILAEGFSPGDGAFGPGTYFARSKKSVMAEGFGRTKSSAILETKIDVRSLFRIVTPEDEKTLRKWFKEASGTAFPSKAEFNSVKSFMEKKGFDGIAVGAEGKEGMFVIFDKERIVAITDKIGPLNLIDEIAKAAGVPKSAASGWLSQWQRGYNLPQGWQSVVRDLEAKAGGFEHAGAEALENAVDQTVLRHSIVEPTVKELDAIKSFTALGGDQASKYQWSSAKNKILEDWLKKQSPMQEPYSSWRGMLFSEKKWDLIFEKWTTEGSEISFDRLQSFSTDSKRVMGYGAGGDVAVKIEFIGRSAIPIDKYSIYNVEKEVLLRPGIRARIKYAEYNRAGGIWNIVMEEIE